MENVISSFYISKTGAMMRILLTLSMSVAMFSVGSILSGQESEIVAPETTVSFAIAEIGESGTLAFNFGSTAPAVSVTEDIPQSYIVEVPYTKQVEKDGEIVNVTKVRREARTRMVRVTRMVPTQETEYKFDELKFLKPDGQEVSAADAKEHFGTRQPIAILNAGQELGEFYELILRDDVLIVQLPAQEADPRGLPVPVPRR